MAEFHQADLSGLAWPVAIAVAWIVGELAHRWLSLPRISSYGIVGFALSPNQGGLLPNPSLGPVSMLADFAFALMLFELGYRINLRWLRTDPWLGPTSLLEAGAGYAAAYLIARAFAIDELPAMLLAALTMSTSPAAVLRVVNEVRSSGQVTERLLHLTAFNCVLTVIAFKAIVGYWLLAGSGSVFQAVWNSVVVVAVSAGIGAAFGVAVPQMLRSFRQPDRDATIAFALAILLLTTLTHALRFSPLLAALAFGLVARHRRATLSQTQRNFGALGDLLTVLLFVFVAASLHWRQIADGAWVALALVAARLVIKTVTVSAFAHLSGITLRKGVLTGLAMMPMSVFVLLLLEQSRHLELGALEQIPGLAAAILALEIFGPMVTQKALVRAEETPQGKGP